MNKMEFGKIRNALDTNKRDASYHRDREGAWRHYDSSLNAIGATFDKTLPKDYAGYFETKIFVDLEERGAVFKKYIEDTLSKSKNKDLFAVEFGGPGSNLFAGFSKGFFKDTVGVCLGDIREQHQKNDDVLNNHSIIQEDILNPFNKGLYKKIFQEIKNEKVDLIISRLQGGLNQLSEKGLVVDTIDKNISILNRIIKNWYKILNENGLIFAQFEYFEEHNPFVEDKYNSEISPPAVTPNEKLIKIWAEKLTKQFPEIEIQLGRGVLRIYKKHGAPEELPDIKDLN